MPNTTIIVTNFTNNYTSRNGRLPATINKIDIARGMLSIGKTHWKQYFVDAKTNILNFIHYWTGLSPYLYDNPSLVVNSRFSSLDQTDKGQKSYIIGMGISKIVAEKILNIPYLQHVDILVSQHIATISGNSNQRGDLIGLDRQRNWHVIEAKGRSNRPSNNIRTKAKQQALNIQTIQGVAPKTRSYCIAYLEETSSEIYLDDPEGNTSDIVELSLSNNDFIKFYYDKLFKDFYEQEPAMQLQFIDQQTTFSLFKLPSDEITLYIGLENNILRELQSQKKPFLSLKSINNEVFNPLSLLNIPNLSFGIDGIVLFETPNNITQKQTAMLNITEQGVGTFRYSVTSPL